MNYGKFFRLNKNLSRTEEGYAVYDYIDLPAYFTRSLDNQMSPKYPVSMSILADSVVFKLHYSAFKIEESSEVLPDQTDSKYPKYLYDIKNNTQKNGGCLKSGDTTKIVHMEETILELPYIDTIGRNLSDTIRDIYNTNFPLILNTTDESGENIKKKDSSGGRFLHNLIRKRYLEENVEEEKDIHSHFYHSLRRISDGTPSYSTLWLMDLMKNGRIDIYPKGKDKQQDPPIIGFLRKLLLDFMFDLKHSDVFQNSECYQKMYSGLMSDFYFSALMHKCEYYYYRDLITKKISDNNIEKDHEGLIGLYADNLYRAEELWTQDIMNPNAEKFFEYHYTMDTPPIPDMDIRQRIDRHLVRFHFVEDNLLLRRDSWFAEPEEEMRRVCFPMDERDEEGNFIKKHFCNTNILVTELRMKPNNKIEQGIISFNEKNKEIISRWFLRRYDFNDVCHLHLSRWSNLFSFSLLFILILLFVSFNTLVEYCIKTIDSDPYLPMWGGLASLFCMSLLFIKRKYQNKNLLAGMVSTYVGQSSKKLLNLVVLLAIFTIGIHWGSFFWVILTLFIICLLFPKSRDFVENVLKKSTSYLHLLFPRLVASITTAWLTMSVGFDLYVAFFDRHVSWSTACMILIIVFIFVMYELNRITPRSNVWKKLFRSVQLVTISYFISLVVGSVVINFLGKQYMDRGGAFEGMTETTFTVDSLTTPIKGVVNNVSFGDSKKERQDKYMQQQHCGEGCQSIHIFHLGEHEIFFMRDFLIMFSFITMFMGIFLQMFIFDEKKMTEF